MTNLLHTNCDCCEAAAAALRTSDAEIARLTEGLVRMKKVVEAAIIVRHVIHDGGHAVSRNIRGALDIFDDAIRALPTGGDG